MHKKTLLLVWFVVFYSGLHAQKGNNSISMNAEFAIPGFQKENGFGFYAKGFYGIGKSGQITVSLGFALFHSSDSVSDMEKGKTSKNLIPVLFGYKQNIGSFFIEPRIGLGQLGGRWQLYGTGDFVLESVFALMGGISAGYGIKRFSFGINFLAAHGVDAGDWGNKYFHYTSMFIGYDLFSNRRH
ncbi:MAG: hypothetical protein C5B59_19545 [Bacteroidetes bacterium]|nr:MAG: hypothetical protein C5B59_19545 [Bacteroidota bacterium]